MPAIDPETENYRNILMQKVNLPEEVGNPPRPSILSDHYADLTCLLKIIDGLIDRSRDLADRLIGEEPNVVIDDVQIDAGPGTVGSLGHISDLMTYRLNSLSYHVTRLERL